MPDTFTYPLTRVCLRSGQLTLPRNMLALFPDEGTVRVVDASSDDEFELTMRSPRHVAGLGRFFAKYELDVNDRVTLTRLADGRVSLTPAPRPKPNDYDRPEVVRALLDKVIELSPLSEAEIRSVAPELPAEFDLRALLEGDSRLALTPEGRWAFVGAAERANDEEQRAEAAPLRTAVTSYPRDDGFESFALNSTLRGPGDVAVHTRARHALQAFGFRVEATPHARLLAHADLGRRRYSTLIHLQSEDETPDWAKLIARRREVGATYLAVFGAHRDLARLQASAAQSGATLWPWQSLTRAQDLLENVPMSPFDLQSHFEQDGLFGPGLERFEQVVEARIAERGTFSLVLSRLATMRAPSVFVLDDVLTDAHLPRDQALSVLERLTGAPFHMLSKVGSGEFCLRVGAAEALTHLSDYALNLRKRLPSSRTERLLGVGETSEEEAANQPDKVAE